MNRVLKYDLISLLAYTFLVIFGIANVYSSSYTESFTSIFYYSTLVGKQLIFLGISVSSLILILFTNFARRDPKVVGRRLHLENYDTLTLHILYTCSK